jgi:death-on-curing protein
MLILSVNEIIQLHDEIIIASGGLAGVRDYGLLESAILGCFQTFGGAELYPSVIDKAARLAYSICKNHPFADGNKRTAVSSMVIFLQIQKIYLIYTQQELITLALNIANDRITHEQIAGWIHAHTR